MATIPALFDVDAKNPGRALKRGLAELLKKAEAAIRDGAALLIVSDRQAGPRQAAIPSLLATGALLL